MSERSIETAYASANDACLVVRHPDPGVVRLKGQDRLDLLQRMSTNDVAALPYGAIRSSVLTNPIGRIVDAIRILSLEGEAMLLTSPGKAEAVRKWLQGYIFYQDDVLAGLDPVSWSEWGFYGPGSREAVQSVFPDLAIPEGEALAEAAAGWVWHVDRPTTGGFHLLLTPEATQTMTESWRGRGGGEIDTAAYQILRIEAGIPEPFHEIREESIPLEVGLRDSISFSKGCYIGQEIIARMDSRGRQARTLVGLRLADEGRPGEAVYQADREVGALTSVARSPAHGWIALATVRPSVLEEDKGRVQIGAGRLPAQCLTLPFSSTRLPAGTLGSRPGSRDQA